MSESFAGDGLVVGGKFNAMSAPPDQTSAQIELTAAERDAVLDALADVATVRWPAARILARVVDAINSERAG